MFIVTEYAALNLVNSLIIDIEDLHKSLCISEFIKHVDDERDMLPDMLCQAFFVFFCNELNKFYNTGA